MQQRLATFSLIWQSIAERLRRPGAVIGLLLMLLLGFIEPLACIIHCSLLDVLAVNQPGVVTQHHHHTVAVTPATASSALLLALPTENGCAQLQAGQHGSGSGNETTLPQPFHELLLLALTLICLVLLVMRRERDATGPPAHVFTPPLGRPPIVCRFA